MTHPPIISWREVQAVRVRIQPGNGTAYDLVVTRDCQGGAAFLWLEGTRIYASGWFGGNEVRWDRKPGSRADRLAIADALALPMVQAILTDVYRGRPVSR